MKRLLYLFLLLLVISCNSLIKNSNSGNFRIVNNSDKVIEYVWIAPEGSFYPVAKNVNIKKGEVYEIEGLKVGVYDIAIDFKNEYNRFNSKKDKNLCLKIEKGLTKVWIVDEDGNIIRN